MSNVDSLSWDDEFILCVTVLTDVSDEFIEMTRMEGDSQREHEHHPSESPEPSSPLMDRHRHSAKAENSQLTITVTTVSAPEVSIMPSPEVSKVICFVCHLG